MVSVRDELKSTKQSGELFGKKKLDRINPKTHPLSTAAKSKQLQISLKPVSYRHKSKNKIFTLPLIVEDIGLGLMLDHIKKEHLVREGVVKPEVRNTRANKTQQTPLRFKTVKPEIGSNLITSPDVFANPEPLTTKI